MGREKKKNVTRFLLADPKKARELSKGFCSIVFCPLRLFGKCPPKIRLDEAVRKKLAVIQPKFLLMLAELGKKKNKVKKKNE